MEFVRLARVCGPKQYSMVNEALPATHPIVYQDFETKLHRPTMTPSTEDQMNQNFNNLPKPNYKTKTIVQMICTNIFVQFHSYEYLPVHFAVENL